MLLSERVAAEIRAWMGRRRIRQSHLARQLKQNEQWVSTRLRGTTPIDLNELQRIADVLEVPVSALLPDLGASGATTIRYPPATDRRPVRPVRLRQMANWGMSEPAVSVRPPDHRPNRRPWPGDQSPGTTRPVRLPRATAA